MNTATELLRRALESFDWMDVHNSVTKEIRAFLDAEPARKPMSEEEIDSKFALDGSMFSSYTAFKQGIRYAEKHHGIGGDDE